MTKLLKIPCIADFFRALRETYFHASHDFFSLSRFSCSATKINPVAALGTPPPLLFSTLAPVVRLLRRKNVKSSFFDMVILVHGCTAIECCACNERVIRHDQGISFYTWISRNNRTFLSRIFDIGLHAQNSFVV